MRLRVGLSFKNRRPGFCWDGVGIYNNVKVSLFNATLSATL
jgi:hypothetical protein